MKIAGKRVLITNYSIGDYAGSENNCLSLAIVLKKWGAIVEVATLNYAYPIRREYEKNQITVRNVIFDKLDTDKYDLIWAHHAIVLNYLLFELGILADKIIFSSLSPFEAYEVAPPYANELSLCLANSQETLLRLIQEGVKEKQCMIFPNYVTSAMYEQGEVAEERKNLKKLRWYQIICPKKSWGL